jgi:hypothetical protein
MKSGPLHLLVGLALVLLLALGVGATVLWPEPSEAERVAEHVNPGMERTPVLVLLVGQKKSLRGLTLWENWEPERGWVEPFAVSGPVRLTSHGRQRYDFKDGSALLVYYDWDRGQEHGHKVTSVRATPATAHTLARLRRTLARIFPALKE